MGWSPDGNAGMFSCLGSILLLLSHCSLQSMSFASHALLVCHHGFRQIMDIPDNPAQSRPLLSRNDLVIACRMAGSGTWALRLVLVRYACQSAPSISSLCAAQPQCCASSQQGCQLHLQ